MDDLRALLRHVWKVNEDWISGWLIPLHVLANVFMAGMLTERWLHG